MRAEGWLLEFQKCHKRDAKKATREVQQWQKPEVGWVKCNFDGAWCHNGSRGSFGVVIRNHFGEFLAAFTGPIEISESAFHAELIAFRSAVILVTNNYHLDWRVIFEGDSNLVIVAVKDQGEDCSPLGPAINDVIFFLRRMAHSRFNHMQDEG